MTGPLIYNFSNHAWPHEAHGLRPCTVLMSAGPPDHEWGRPNPHVRGIWRDRSKSPDLDDVRTAIETTDPGLPVIFNGEWDSRWSGSYYDSMMPVLRAAWEACGGQRPIGVYGTPVSRRRSNHEPRWVDNYNEFLARPFRALDDRGLMTRTGAATYLTWCCPSLYYGRRAVSWQDFERMTHAWFGRIRALYQRPIFPFLSIERWDRADSELWSMDDWQRYVEHALSLPGVCGLVLWMRHNTQREIAEPYVEAMI